MANYNIQMNMLNSSGTYDVLWPETIRFYMARYVGTGSSSYSVDIPSNLCMKFPLMISWGANSDDLVNKSGIKVYDNCYIYPEIMTISTYDTANIHTWIEQVGIITSLETATFINSGSSKGMALNLLIHYAVTREDDYIISIHTNGIYVLNRSYTVSKANDLFNLSGVTYLVIFAYI